MMPRISDQADPHDAARLKRVRRQLGLSVNQMARALGCSERTLRRWQKGSHSMPGQVLIRLRELEGGGLCAG